MTRPDLSFFDPPGGLPPQVDVASPDDTWLPRPHGVPVDASPEMLVSELRAYQAELESQNQVLRYSQDVAESALERFETLFARVPLALMVVDDLDMVVQANSMAHRTFQPTEKDRPLSELMPFVDTVDIQRVHQAFTLAKTQGHSEISEVLFVMGAHHRIVGDLHIALLESTTTDLTTPVQFLCAVIDQSPVLEERRALQQSAAALQERNAQLRAGEKRLEAVINSALDAIICVDQNRRITVFNPTAAALFQCGASDALGNLLERFLPDAGQILSMAQVTTQAMLGEMTALTAGGITLEVEVSVSFERNSDGEITTIFARDLTGRKRAEAHRNALELQLRESHKMQAVGTMAGGIAHDFNNILSAILGNVDLAKTDCGTGSPALESLLEIEKAGRRARDLVRQILTFSRNEPPQRSAVQLHEVGLETEQLIRVTLPPSIDLHLDIPAHLPPVLADATQVEQALLNLCTNAAHAIGSAKGAIEVSAKIVHADQWLCERIQLTPGHYAVLSVRDTGPGMDDATLERIFEPFFTTKPVGQGTGLGLAVVHGVMRTHGGAIDVQSTLGRGSRFSLYFPLANAQGTAPVSDSAFSALMADTPSTTFLVAEKHKDIVFKLEKPTAKNTATTPLPAPSNPARAAHVMYVDDDEALVFLVQRLLRRQGYQVSGFNNPHLAIEALEKHPHDYDLVVTDYNMPGFCGVDLVRAAKRIRSNLPVALASGYITTEIEEAALTEGADALVYKPNDAQELCDTVHRLVYNQQGS